MNNKNTYTVKLRTECNLETNATNMTDTIIRSLDFIRKTNIDGNEEWYEIEVIDNITELSVFKERKIK